MFLVFFAVASLSQAFMGVGWTSWVRVWVPSKLRGKYFGQRNRWLNAGTVVFLLLALVLFECDETALWPYQVLIVVAVLARYGGLIWQHGIRTSAEHLDVVGHGWLAQLRENFAARGLLRFIIFSSWTSFWMAFAGPFIPVFCFEELGIAPGTFTLFVVLATVSGIFGWWFWGRKVDRHGCVLILVVGLALWELLNLLWAVLDRDNTWLLYPLMLLGGFVSVGYFAASFNLLLKLVPASSKVRRRIALGALPCRGIRSRGLPDRFRGEVPRVAGGSIFAARLAGTAARHATHVYRSLPHGAATRGCAGCEFPRTERLTALRQQSPAPYSC